MLPETNETHELQCTIIYEKYGCRGCTILKEMHDCVYEEDIMKKKHWITLLLLILVLIGGFVKVC